MRHPTALIILLTLAGCSSTPVDVVELMQHSQCKNLQVGANRISFEQLATIRGSRLLSTTPDSASSAQATADSDPMAEPMYAIYTGPQPTAGYRLSLQQVSQRNRTVSLHLTTTKPAPDVMVSQVITHPCIVVQLQGLPHTYTVEFLLDDNPDPLPVVP